MADYQHFPSEGELFAPAPAAVHDNPPPSAPPPSPAKPTRPHRWFAWLIAAVLAALAIAIGAFFAGSRETQTTAVATVDPPPATVAPTVAAPSPPTSLPAAPPTSLPTAPPTSLPAAPPDRISAVLLDASVVGDSVIPSVVTVQIGGVAPNGGQAVFGSGSGVVYDTRGHILTNDHVVAAGTRYDVVLADGRIYPAELVGTDPSTDLAVLSVSTVDLDPIELGSSDRLTVGDPAVAVGSPLGLDGGPSLTVGVISAFGREVQTSADTRLYGMLQTDAPITQGSSGGALVDGAGRLIGITTAVGVSDVGIEGIGFATPIEVVERVANEIIAGGEASRPYLGIFGATAFEETADGGSAPIGVTIETVEPNTAAAAAGLVAGDVIAAINGNTVRTMDELAALLRRYGAGTLIDVTLEGGATIAVTLGERPDA